jgi:hypothetical protein
LSADGLAAADPRPRRESRTKDATIASRTTRARTIHSTSMATAAYEIVEKGRPAGAGLRPTAGEVSR